MFMLLWNHYSLDHKTGHTCECGQGHPIFPSFFLLRLSEISVGLFLHIKEDSSFCHIFLNLRVYYIARIWCGDVS